MAHSMRIRLFWYMLIFGWLLSEFWLHTKIYLHQYFLMHENLGSSFFIRKAPYVNLSPKCNGVCAKYRIADLEKWKSINFFCDMWTSLTKGTFSYQSKLMPSIIISGMQRLNSHFYLKLFLRIRFFVVCSIVGVLVLLPLNYTGSTVPNTSSHSMDAFTISNISSGSDR